MRIIKTTERWFDVPDDPDRGRLKIKHLTPGETSDIFDKVFTQEIRYKKGAKGKFEPAISHNTDKKLDRELTLTKSIVDWENFFDKDNNPMECTPENIIKAGREIDGFNDLVTELRETLAEDIKKEREDQTKNLPSSASEPAS